MDYFNRNYGSGSGYGSGLYRNRGSSGYGGESGYGDSDLSGLMDNGRGNYLSGLSSSFGNFSETNSIIANISFLFLVLFVFMILLKVGVSVLGWFYSYNETPHLIDGMVSGKQRITFEQDPSVANSKTIIRSTNANQGMEFSWSLWVFIDDLQYNAGQYRHVFSKGNSDTNTEGMVAPNNAPGLYIAPNRNDFVIVMNTYNVINEEIIVPDIPLNKWVYVTIRLENRNLDVYINGSIARSALLTGVPKQNYGDVFVGLNGGFDGYVSNLWYYDYALSVGEIGRIMSRGPNTKMVASDVSKKMKSNYLSLRWYFSGASDQINPSFQTSNLTPTSGTLPHGPSTF